MVKICVCACFITHNKFDIQAPASICGSIAGIHKNAASGNISGFSGSHWHAVVVKQNSQLYVNPFTVSMVHGFTPIQGALKRQSNSTRLIECNRFRQECLDAHQVT